MLKNQKLRIILILAIIVAIALFFIYNPEFLSLDTILSYSPENPWLAAAVLIAIFSAKAFLMVIPVFTLYLAAGLLFPPAWAIFVVCIGLAAELSLGYIAGRKLGRDRVAKRLESKPKISAILLSTGISRHETMCFAARVLPLPFDLMSMLFGSIDVSYWKYIIFSILGTLPTMIPYVLAGTAIENPLSKEFLIPFGISLGFSIVVFVILTLVTRSGIGKRRQTNE